MRVNLLNSSLFLCLFVFMSRINGQISTSAPTVTDYGDDSDDDTVNLIAVGGYYTETQPRCVFPFRFNGKLHNGCLSPVEYPPHNPEDNPAEEAPEYAAESTGGVLGWCPHNFERLDHDPPIRFSPFDTYEDPGQYKKLWGYCSCEGGFFWQRLPNAGYTLDNACHMGTITAPFEEMRSSDCRNYCDDTHGCQGYEFAKFKLQNSCRIFKCIRSSTVTVDEFFNYDMNNATYKQQIKRPCEEATVDFDGTPIYNERNVTHYPTTSPTFFPTRSPTHEQKIPTGSPVILSPVETFSPTVYPTQFPVDPTAFPTEFPTAFPVVSPKTGSPTIFPTTFPTPKPTPFVPTEFPTFVQQNTKSPTASTPVSKSPTGFPTPFKTHTNSPTSFPVVTGEIPNGQPTGSPTGDGNKGNKVSPAGRINPLAYTMPLILIVLISVLVLFAIYKKRKDAEDDEADDDDKEPRLLEEESPNDGGNGNEGSVPEVKQTENMDKESTAENGGMLEDVSLNTAAQSNPVDENQVAAC